MAFLLISFYLLFKRPFFLRRWIKAPAPPTRTAQEREEGYARALSSKAARPENARTGLKNKGCDEWEPKRRERSFFLPPDYKI